MVVRRSVDLAPYVRGSRVLAALTDHSTLAPDSSEFLKLVDGVPTIDEAGLGGGALSVLRTALSTATDLAGLEVKLTGQPKMPLAYLPSSTQFRSHFRDVYDSWLISKLSDSSPRLLLAHENLLRAAAVAVETEALPGSIAASEIRAWLDSLVILVPWDPATSSDARADLLSSEHHALLAAGFTASESVALISAEITSGSIPLDAKPKWIPTVHPLVGQWLLTPEVRYRCEGPLGLTLADLRFSALTFTATIYDTAASVRLSSAGNVVGTLSLVTNTFEFKGLASGSTVPVDLTISGSLADGLPTAVTITLQARDSSCQRTVVNVTMRRP